MRPAWIAAMVVLTACSSPITAENTTRSTAGSGVGSERTYRNILTALRDCYPTPFVIDAQYFPEAKEGEIMLSSVTEPSRVEFAKLTVSEVDGKATVIMLSRKTFERLPSALPNWVQADSKVCPYGARIEAPYPSHNPYSTVPR